MASVTSIKAVDGTRVLGLADVVAKMRYLSRSAGVRVVRKGLYAGATVVRDYAKGKVKVDTGALRNSIVAQTNNRRKEKDKYFAKVTIARKAFRFNEKGKLKVQKRKKGERKYQRGDIYPRNYAHLVEFGTKPHSLKKKTKRYIGVRGLGVRVTHQEPGPANHPGTRAQPFMRPAYDNAGDAAVTKITEVVRTELDKELAKLKPGKKAA